MFCPLSLFASSRILDTLLATSEDFKTSRLTWHKPSKNYSWVNAQNMMENIRDIFKLNEKFKLQLTNLFQ